MKIRKARPEDYRKIANLRKKTFENINAKVDGYTKKQIEVLHKKNYPKRILEKMKERDMFCLEDKGKILGVIDLKNNNIGGFFVRHTYIRTGLGTQLISFIENYARKKGIKKIELEATRYAYPFYLKQGYKYIREKVNDSGVLNYIMEKKL